MYLNPTGCYAIRILRLLYIGGELKNDDKKNHHDHLLVDRVRNNNLRSYRYCRLNKHEKGGAGGESETALSTS